MTRQVRLLTLSALICALIIVSTLWLKFTIPGTDVMFSSQVFFVLLCGLLLPPRYCFYTLGRLPAAGTGRTSGVYRHRRPRRHRHPVLWVFDRLSV